MEHIKQASALILFIRNRTSYNTSGSWIEWRETILPVFENQKDTGSINALVNAGKINSGKIKDLKTLENFLGNINKKDREGIIELLFLFRYIDERRSDYSPGTFNTEVWNQILNILNIEPQQLAIAKEKARQWLETKKENNFKTFILIPASILPIFLDFILRCCTLLVFQTGGLVLVNNNGPTALFSASQILFIPILIIVFAIIRDRRIARRGQFLISKINISNIQFKIKNSAWHYLAVFILAASGSYVPVLIFGEELPALAVVVMFLLYGMYLLILQTNFSKTVPEYQMIRQQIEEKEHRELSETLNTDQNDEEIINLEVNLKAENERMDAYVIEAALFGALAFSCFLQITSAGNFTVSFIESFNLHLHEILHSIVTIGEQNVGESYAFIFGKEGLMVVLCYQALFCSVFFLSVIGSRLRYSKLTDYVDRYLQLSKSLNEKEEFLFQKEKVNVKGVAYYTEKIRHLLREGYKKQDEIAPIMEYMKFFRTLGISMFFIIIITSGLFISPWLSFVLFFISSLSMFYFRLGKAKAALKSFYISMQEFYYRVDKPVHWICWGLILVAIVMRSFLIEGGGMVMAVGFMLLFVHYLLNLFIPIEFDYDVKKPEDAFGSYATFQKLLAYIFKIAIALFFLGFMFKSMHWPGASAMIIVSILMLCGYFFSVKKVPRGPAWLGYLLSISISLALIGIMFRLQHWPWNGFIPYLSIPLIIITGIITFIKREQIRPLLKRTVLIICLLAFFFLSDYTRRALWSLNFNYELYLKIKNKEIAWDQIENAARGKSNLSSSIESERDSLKVLINNFNKYFLLEEKSPNEEDLNQISWIVYESSDDSLLLSEALKWSVKSVELHRNWIHLDTYASLLYKLHKFQEAKPIAEEAYSIGKDPSTKKLLEKINQSLPDTIQN